MIFETNQVRVFFPPRIESLPFLSDATKPSSGSHRQQPQLFHHKERTPFRRPRRYKKIISSPSWFCDHWLQQIKISKHLFLGASEIWLHPALKSFKMGEHSAGGVGFDQTATIFAPLRRIKNTTLTCALTGWKSSASPVRCNNRVWVCPLFGVSFIPWVFSDHGAMCSFKKIYSIVYAFMVEAWESKLSKDTSLMNRR